MLWVVVSMTFVSTVLVLLSVVAPFAPGEGAVSARLERLMNPAARNPSGKFVQRHKDRAQEYLAKVGKLVPVASGTRASTEQIMMMRAGYRSADAMLAIRGVKILLPIVFVATTLLTGIYRYSPFFILLAAVIAGY